MPPRDEAVYLNGWDTVAALRLKALNAAIAASRSWPDTLSARYPDGPALRGRFADWRVAPSGSGSLLDIAMTVTDAHVSGEGLDRDGLEFDALVEVSLDFVNAGVAAGSLSRSSTLVIDMEGEEGDPPIVVKSTSLDAHPDAFVLASLVRDLLQRWLNANAAAFDHVFAGVELGRAALQPRFQWLQPTSHAYGYTALGEDDGCLAILSMTQGRAAAGRSDRVPPLLFADGHDAAFAISTARFMENVMVPVLTGVFHGLAPKDLKIAEPDGVVTLAGGPVSFEAKTDGGGTAPATLEHLRVELTGSVISLKASTRSEVDAEHYAVAEARSELSVVAVPGSSPVRLRLHPVHPPEITHTVHDTQGRRIEEAALGMLAAGLMMGGLASGNIVIVFFGALAGLADATLVLEDVEAASEDDPGEATLEAFSADASAAVEWPLAGAFEARSARFDVSLILSGDMG